MTPESPPTKKRFFAAVIGTALVALCCFTPLLVILLSLVGLSALTPHLDYVLLPALVLGIVLIWMSYKHYKQSCAIKER